jgi:predicted metallopeptidase
MKVKHNDISIEALSWFEKEISKIKNILNIEVPIYATDFRKNSRALATIHGYKNGLGIAPLYIIFDTFTVQECYDHEVLNQRKPAHGQKLLEIICHEIAHIDFWQHGKYHKQQIKILINKIEKHTKEKI